MLHAPEKPRDRRHTVYHGGRLGFLISSTNHCPLLKHGARRHPEPRSVEGANLRFLGMTGRVLGEAGGSDRGDAVCGATMPIRNGLTPPAAKWYYSAGLKELPCATKWERSALMSRLRTPRVRASG